MFTRYLSFALGGALVAFAVYHWLLINSLTSELRSKDSQLAQHAQRLGSLQLANATLNKEVDEYKLRLEDQASALRLMQVAQTDVEQRLRTATADAERQASQCARQRPLIQVVKAGGDAKCAALKRRLDQYIAHRQRPRSPGEPAAR